MEPRLDYVLVLVFLSLGRIPEMELVSFGEVSLVVASLGLPAALADLPASSTVAVSA